MIGVPQQLVAAARVARVRVTPTLALTDSTTSSSSNGARNTPSTRPAMSVATVARAFG